MDNNQQEHISDHPDEDNAFAGHPIDEIKTKQLSLSPIELLSIDDGLSLLVNKNEFDGAITLRPVYPSAGIGCSIDLLSKVGQAVLKMSENLEKPTNQTIEVTDVDIFILRELVISQVVKMDKSVALGMRLKLYELLYSEFIAEEATNESVASLLEVSNKDGKLGKVLDEFKAEAEHEN